MQTIFEENKSELLAGAILWTPMLSTDSLDAAAQQELTFSDARLKQLWDPERLFGSLMSQDLPLARRQHEMITTAVSVTNRCHY